MRLHQHHWPPSRLQLGMASTHSTQRGSICFFLSVFPWRRKSVPLDRKRHLWRCCPADMQRHKATGASFGMREQTEDAGLWIHTQYRCRRPTTAEPQGSAVEPHWIQASPHQPGANRRVDVILARSTQTAQSLLMLRTILRLLSVAFASPIPSVRTCKVNSLNLLNTACPRNVQ